MSQTHIAKEEVKKLYKTIMEHIIDSSKSIDSKSENFSRSTMVKYMQDHELIRKEVESFTQGVKDIIDAMKLNPAFQHPGVMMFERATFKMFCLPGTKLGNLYENIKKMPLTKDGEELKNALEGMIANMNLAYDRFEHIFDNPSPASSDNYEVKEVGAVSEF